MSSEKLQLSQQLLEEARNLLEKAKQKADDFGFSAALNQHLKPFFVSEAHTLAQKRQMFTAMLNQLGSNVPNYMDMLKPIDDLLTQQEDQAIAAAAGQAPAHNSDASVKVGQTGALPSAASGTSLLAVGAKPATPLQVGKPKDMSPPDFSRLKELINKVAKLFGFEDFFLSLETALGAQLTLPARVHQEIVQAVILALETTRPNLRAFVNPSYVNKELSTVELVFVPTAWANLHQPQDIPVQQVLTRVNLIIDPNQPQTLVTIDPMNFATELRALEQEIRALSNQSDNLELTAVLKKILSKYFKMGIADGISNILLAGRGLATKLSLPLLIAKTIQEQAGPLVRAAEKQEADVRAATAEQEKLTLKRNYVKGELTRCGYCNKPRTEFLLPQCEHCHAPRSIILYDADIAPLKANINNFIDEWIKRQGN